MATLKVRRTTKRGSVLVDIEVNGCQAYPYDSAVILSNLFPGVELIHGGLLLAIMNLKCQGQTKCFSFDRAIDFRTEPFVQLETSLKARLHQVRNWVREIPVVEEFTIEI